MAAIYQLQSMYICCIQYINTFNTVWLDWLDGFSFFNSWHNSMAVVVFRCWKDTWLTYIIRPRNVKISQNSVENFLSRCGKFLKQWKFRRSVWKCPMLEFFRVSAGTPQWSHSQCNVKRNASFHNTYLWHVLCCLIISRCKSSQAKWCINIVSNLTIKTRSHWNSLIFHSSILPQHPLHRRRQVTW